MSRVNAVGGEEGRLEGRAEKDNNIATSARERQKEREQEEETGRELKLDCVIRDVCRVLSRS